MEFKELWDLESAMQVLENKTVDGKLWAEAVEWLLKYGPPEIQQVLLDASDIATASTFPELKPSNYASDGQSFYDIAALAKALDITENKAREILADKEKQSNNQFGLGSDNNTIVH